MALAAAFALLSRMFVVTLLEVCRTVLIWALVQKLLAASRAGTCLVWCWSVRCIELTEI
jgi:hypothetical protein